MDVFREPAVEKGVGEDGSSGLVPFVGAQRYQKVEEVASETDLLLNNKCCSKAQEQELQASASTTDLLTWMYIISWFVQGVSVISMETSISCLAQDLGIDVALVSSALIFRSIGSAVGSLSSGFLIRRLGAHSLLFNSCILMGGFIAFVPHAQNLEIVWFLFFVIGACVNLQISAASVLPKQMALEDQSAGKTFQMFFVGNGLGINAVPFIERYQPYERVLLGFGVAAFLFGWIGHCLELKPGGDMLASPETTAEEDGNQENISGLKESSWKRFLDKLRKGSINRFDFAVAIMLLLLTNVMIQTDSFLTTYMESSGLENISSGVLSAFLAGALIVQTFFAFFYKVTLQQLYILMPLGLVLATTAFLGLAFWPLGSTHFREAVVWFVFVVAGMCLGPLFGWSYDLWNRITDSSEDGAALISLFTHLTTWVSFLMFQIYDLTGDKNILLYFNSAELSMALVVLASVRFAQQS